MSVQIENQRNTVLEREVSKLAPPPMYRVILLNDDYTPMEFVVNVLQRIFDKSADEAERLMLRVHYEGSAVCGIYTRDIAASKVEIVRQVAQARQHPLQCVMEPTPET